MENKENWVNPVFYMPGRVTSILSTLYFSGQKLVVMHPGGCPTVSSPCGSELCGRGQDWRMV